MAEIIYGAPLANEITDKVKRTLESHSLRPTLRVILASEHPSSQIYVARKKKACEAVGIHCDVVVLPTNVDYEKIASIIAVANADARVHGILLQLPLPAHLPKFKLLSLISPQKDVDGLGPQSQGLLNWGEDALYPCTPLGIAYILERHAKIEGSLVAMIGQSVLVGSSTGRLLTQKGATVIGIHSRTPHPERLTRQADIVIAAAGVPRLVTVDWVKEGAMIVDVGIHRVNDKIVGDVDFDSVLPKVAKITPVPGGVGPMTIAMLIQNLLRASYNC